LFRGVVPGKITSGSGKEKKREEESPPKKKDWGAPARKNCGRKREQPTQIVRKKKGMFLYFSFRERESGPPLSNGERAWERKNTPFNMRSRAERPKKGGAEFSFDARKKEEKTSHSKKAHGARPICRSKRGPLPRQRRRARKQSRVIDFFGQEQKGKESQTQQGASYLRREISTTTT